MARAARARAATRRWRAVLSLILAVPVLVLLGNPLPSVAEAATRTGDLWTVTPGASAEIQPAIDAARDNGGGRVRLPAGVYLLSSKVRLHSNVTLYGDGMDQTILRWTPGATLDHMMSNATLTEGNTNIQVWSLTLDGQGRASGRTDCCFGLRLNNVRNSVIANVAADSHSKDGIYIGYNRTNGAVNVRVSGCRANNNVRNGISLVHGDSNVIDGCQVDGNNRGEAVAGIDVEPDESLSVTNSKIVGNTANGQNVGIQIFLPFNGYATTYHNAVCYNRTSGNVSAGVYSHRGDQNIFVDNQSSGNGTDFLVDDSSLIGSSYAGWCTLGALPPHPSTIVDPKPRPSCGPRPPVTVTTRPGGPSARGTLQVTVGVTRSAAAPDNSISALQFMAAQNGTVEINGQSRPGGNFTLPISGGPQQVTFTVRRDDPTKQTTVPFAVVDDCGAWQTFVGGGPTAF